jgi:protein TonB
VRTSVLVAASLVLHVGGFAVISRKAKQIEKKQALIAVVEQKKKQEEEKKKEPPKPVEAPKEVLRPKAPAPPSEAPPPPSEPVVNNTPSAAMQALPDVGLVGGGGGAGGFAVPGGKGGPPGAASKTDAPKPAEKALGSAAKAAAGDPALAEEIAAWKPKPKARVKPVYPDEARAAEIEGTVTVEVVIDCTGKVTSSKVLQSLGHGLDQAALTAIQKTEFEPAPKCAPGFSKTMKINYAFRLGD